MAGNVMLEPQRIKFIVISTPKPCQKSGLDGSCEYEKRTKGGKTEPRDVDYLYLKNNFLKEYKDAERHKFYMNYTVGELSKKFDGKGNKWGDFDCFVFVFLTYVGGPNTGPEALHLYDDTISLDKLLEEVGEISQMRDKPKVFLVQADDVGMLSPAKKGGDSFKVKKIPTDSDRLTIISTIPAKIFQRGEDEPSLLIQAFVEEVNANRRLESPLDLLSLTTNINRKVLRLIEVSTLDERKGPIEKSSLPVPCTTSTLRRPLKL